MHLMPEDRRSFRSLDRSGSDGSDPVVGCESKAAKNESHRFFEFFRTKEMAEGIAQNSTLSFSGHFEHFGISKSLLSQSDTTARYFLSIVSVNNSKGSLI